MSRRLVWVAPPHAHRVRYRVWCWCHWRRVRAFRRYLEGRLREEFQRRMWSERQENMP